MAIILTGGTGKTSIGVAELLQSSKIPFVLCSRRGEEAAPAGMPAAKFEWSDASTYDAPFQHKSLSGEKASAVWLVAPPVAEPQHMMNAFVDQAIEKHGVKRFVLVGGTSVQMGGHFVGTVWQHLVDRKVEWCMLKPTWFDENFLEGAPLASIKNEGKIYTGTGNARIPFVAVKDISAVGFCALTDPKSHDCAHLIKGPELLTYDDAAARFSSTLGKKVEHVKLNGDQNMKHKLGWGMPASVAGFLCWLEDMTLNGLEDDMSDHVEKVTGRPPQKLGDWIEQNKTAWST